MTQSKYSCSILIPTFNRRHLLGFCLASVFGQTFQDFQVIIYDDGSVDGTEEFVKTYCDKTNRLIYHKGTENKGVSYARNFLLDVCDTEFACWQDSDDMSNIYRLQILMNTIFEQKCNVVNSCFDAWGTPKAIAAWQNIPEDAEPSWRFYERGGGATVLFRTSEALPYNQNLLIGEDTEWREHMNAEKGQEFLVHKILYYVNFTPENRLSKKAGFFRRKYPGRTYP